MLLVLFIQTGTASPLGSCATTLDGQQGTHDQDPVASAEHGGTAASDHMAILIWPDVPKNKSPASDSCVATAHCALSLAATLAPGPRVRLTVEALEEPGPSWFLHVAPFTHVTPPPRA